MCDDRDICTKDDGCFRGKCRGTPYCYDISSMKVSLYLHNNTFAYIENKDPVYSCN